MNVHQLSDYSHAPGYNLGDNPVGRAGRGAAALSLIALLRRPPRPSSKQRTSVLILLHSRPVGQASNTAQNTAPAEIAADISKEILGISIWLVHEAAQCS
jgi:hypothetical protein